jgi:hypothetical protein
MARPPLASPPLGIPAWAVWLALATLVVIFDQYTLRP